MFYVEVQLDPAGLLSDVKVAHHGEPPMLCPELVQQLREKNFEAFSQHLKGLVNLYKLPGDNKLKTKMYLALQSLELDLTKMAAMYWQATNAGTLDRILHGAVGLLTPRSGGHALSLTYYVSPYDLFDDVTAAAVAQNEGQGEGGARVLGLTQVFGLIFHLQRSATDPGALKMSSPRR
ncbi:mediator of RNA polymerase II transcription subunit 1-like, partial [Ascaphus truei]|uniref:mediator of RNA polymerase II transcription subunit 1-like n=1 Tax=Ascaphus truei TaxID=8439 RepID=UPI003F594A89